MAAYLFSGISFLRISFLHVKWRPVSFVLVKFSAILVSTLYSLYTPYFSFNVKDYTFPSSRHYKSGVHLVSWKERGTKRNEMWTQLRHAFRFEILDRELQVSATPLEISWRKGEHEQNFEKTMWTKLWLCSIRGRREAANVFSQEKNDLISKENNQ